MRFASALRRVWPSPSPSASTSPARRPRAPRHLAQEQVVVAAYRDRLSALSRALRARWAAFDAEPDDYTVVSALRRLRAELTLALEAYHAALGARDNAHLRDVLAEMRSADHRLARLDADVAAEVARFDHASLDSAARFAAAPHPLARASAAGDASDVLIELELYRATWGSIMGPDMRARLDHAHAVLRDVVDAHPHPHYLSAPGAVPPAYLPDPPAYLPDPAPPARPPAPPAREYGSSESGDDGPMNMVFSRTRTLRDVAQHVLRAPDPRAPDPRGPDPRALASPASSLDQPPLSAAKNMSFASTLYHTRNARVDAISDAGITLRRSNVRGDGRCLFRALARLRIVAAAGPIPAERVERDAADELRHRAVEELRKHRRLLATFFVIEGNFDQYTKKMSHPRTYGGEPELLMLAKLLHIPIAVYILKDATYRQIQVYGKQYRGDPLRILYSDGVHYDALLAIRYS